MDARRLTLMQHATRLTRANRNDAPTQRRTGAIVGTRHLIVVMHDGKYKVAQYGQWDGYPEGQGLKVLRFLRREFNRETFLARLARTFEPNETQIAELNQQLEAGAPMRHLCPSLSRDTGGDILALIQNSRAPVPLKNNILFAADSLYCEYAYVIDLDKNTFEVFKGFNEEPLSGGERFYGFVDPDKMGKKYEPVKFVIEWPLDALPTDRQFLVDLGGDPDEAGEEADADPTPDAPALAEQIVAYFDEWELTLPADARDTLAPIVAHARASLKG